MFNKVKKFVKDHKKQFIAGAIFAGGAVVGGLVVKHHYNDYINLKDYTGVLTGITDDGTGACIAAVHDKSGKVKTFFTSHKADIVEKTGKSLIVVADMIRKNKEASK